MENIYLTQFAAESASTGILGLNLEAFLVQLVTFVLAIIVLKRFAAKPILAKLEERRQTIEQGVQLGEKMQKDQAKTAAKIDEQLKQARVEADEIIAQAHERGRQAVAEAEDKARKKAEGIVSSAKDRLDQDIQKARKQLEAEMSGLVAEATEAVIHEKVDAKKDAALIDKAMKGKA